MPPATSHDTRDCPIEIPGDWRIHRAADIAGDTALRRLGPDSEFIELLEPRRIWYGDTREDYHDVPSKFISDGTSIPWFFRRLIPRDRGRHWVPSLMHDHYYATGEVDQVTADRHFRESMRIYGVGFILRWGMYYGLRLGGFAAWNTHRRREQFEAAKAE